MSTTSSTSASTASIWGHRRYERAPRPAIVVADPLSTTASICFAKHAGCDRRRPMPTHLRAVLPSSDALIVRSRTKVTAELLGTGRASANRGRAGIGVDNIDVDAATDRGILVVNAPLGNVRSTAEHTIALIFALARRVPAADAAVRDGTWKTGYEGVQVAGKRLGVLEPAKSAAR